MGICRKQLQGNIFTPDFLQELQPIGKGNFGVVLLVRHKLTRTLYALKKISKIQTIIFNAVEQVLDQRIFLSQLNTPFVPTLITAYQQDSWLCLLMVLAEGVSLRECLMQKYMFVEREGIIITASIMMLLQHMHSNHILHRDLKPENIILSEDGVKIVDLGIAKRLLNKENAGETSGTLAYLAPETLFRQNYDYTVDYYSLGVILHEIIFGMVPIYRQNQKQMMDIFTRQQYEITKQTNWSSQAVSFVNQLLQVRPANRLGAKGPQQLREHPWFKKYGQVGFEKENLKLNIKGVKKQAVGEIQDEDIGQISERERKWLQSPKLFKGFNYLNEQVNDQTLHILNNQR